MDNDKLISALKESPVFAMSLGGRELFHSNFWAWLMRTDPMFINAFFPDTVKECEKTEDGFIINGDEVDPHTLIKREEKHHDITIHLGGKVLIIENKIKSLPSKKQLDKYLYDAILDLITTEEYKNVIASFVPHLSDKMRNKLYNISNKSNKKLFDELKNKDCKDRNKDPLSIKVGLLTGLLQIKDTSYECWNYLSYSEIRKNIQNILNNSTIIKAGGFNQNLINQYLDDIGNLSKAINDAIKETGDKYYFDLAERFKIIRFDDVFKKLKMDHFMNNFKSGIDSENLPTEKNGFKLIIKSDFANKKANLTVKYEHENEEGRYAIGIQIEEYSFRYFVEMPNLANKIVNANKDCKEFSELVKCGWFVKSGKKFHEENLASRGNPCNKYAPDMIYQHYNLSKKLEYDNLKQKIINAFSSDEFEKAFEYVKCQIQ